MRRISMTAIATTQDHKTVVAQLSRAERDYLLEKSDRAGVVQLSVHIAAMCLMALGMASGGVIGWLCLIAYGVLLVFLFTAQHECVHFTAFKTRWANQWVANVVGALLFNPARWFRYFHLAHHRYTQDPDNDPELASAKPDSLFAYISHVIGWRVLVSGVGTVLRNAFGDLRAPWLPANQHAAVRREARGLVLLYSTALVASVVFGSTLLLTYWLLPLVVGQPFLRLYLLAEHGRCPAVANMFENTRTTFTNAFVRRLAWNMPYHTEHHAFPSVPFHRLPTWHQTVREHLRCTANGYARFNRNYLKDTV